MMIYDLKCMYDLDRTNNQILVFLCSSIINWSRESVKL